MVQFSTLFLAITASFSAAYPSQPEKSNALVSRAAPATGDELTLQKTVNNMDDGTFTEDGGDVVLNVGDKVGEGSAGMIFTIDCMGRPECDDLGKVVLKYYTDTDQVEDEQKHLAKIGELKAVLTAGDDRYTLLTQWEGDNFSKLPKYIELLEDEEGNKEAITALLDSAISKTVDDAKAYLENNHIFHGDINDANVLMMESDGSVTSAKVIDWDKADIISDDDLEAALGEMEGVVQTAFERFRPE